MRLIPQLQLQGTSKIEKAKFATAMSSEWPTTSPSRRARPSVEGRRLLEALRLASDEEDRFWKKREDRKVSTNHVARRTHEDVYHITV